MEDLESRCETMHKKTPPVLLTHLFSCMLLLLKSLQICLLNQNEEVTEVYLFLLSDFLFLCFVQDEVLQNMSCILNLSLNKSHDRSGWKTISRDIFQ